MTATMIEDERNPSILDLENGERYVAGTSVISKIEAYEESGQMAPVVWFAIYKPGGDQPYARINSAYVRGIRY